MLRAPLERALRSVGATIHRRYSCGASARRVEITCQHRQDYRRLRRACDTSLIVTGAPEVFARFFAELQFSGCASRMVASKLRQNGFTDGHKDGGACDRV